MDDHAHRTSAAITIGDLRIGYRSRGTGPPLVLLHGFVGDSREWEAQLADLSSDFTVIAWDAPGAGQSSDPPPHYRMPDYADRLADLLEALDLGAVHLVGLSFGGSLALEFYRRHPSRVRTLILTSAYAGWTGSLSTDVVADRLRLSLRLADEPIEEFVAAMLPTLFPPSTPAEVLDGYGAIVAGLHPEGFRTMVHALAEADLRETLPTVAVPTLLVYGDADVRSPRPVADAIHAAIPGSRLVILPGIGHMINVQAAPQLNRAIRAFLDRGS
jgi:pimeloyl-ACP methyl ester carboxylesterase